MRDNPVYKIIAVRTVQASVPALLCHLLLHWPLTGRYALGLWMTVGLCVYFVFVFVGEWTWGLPIMRRLPVGAEGVALTFDDGPSETTTRILDVLHEYHAHATFFVLGERISERPDLVRRIVAEGHTLGLHGLSHTEMVLPSRASVERDIGVALALLHTAVPSALPLLWLRPPHGFKSATLPFILRRLGLRMVAWSVSSRDYKQNDPMRIATQVLKHIRPRSIVLLHDGAGNGATADALPHILDGLSAQGLSCVLLQALPHLKEKGDRAEEC